MDGKTLARLGAVAFVAIAIVATAIEMNRHDDLQDSATTQGRPTLERDPLEAELTRCSGIGEAGARDASCLKAWGENRRRFLRQPAPGASGAPVAPSSPATMPTLFPNAPTSADPRRPEMQPEPARTEAR